ncbi:MAG: 4Fe-4S binding protein [Candidatus Azobacteroides sp.]|nr:4Fe-4S binding protein [Candidatus Azobacteroides sp.]
MLPEKISLLANIQLIPALLAINIGVLLFLLVLTFIFGRIYCSVICPLGIFQDVIRRFSNLFRKKKQRYAFRYARAKNILRYVLLGLTAVAIISGFGLFTALIDPYSAYGRIITHIFKPVFIAGNNLIAEVTAKTGDYLTLKTDLEMISFMAFIIAVISLVVVSYMAWTRGRSYCNTICPVGTFLGIISKYSLFKVSIDSSKCHGCALCERKCKSHCINSKEYIIDNSRCVACYNCLGSCKKDAINYYFSVPFSSKKNTLSETSESVPDKTEIQTPDSSRREFLSTAFTAVLSTFGVFAAGKASSVIGEDKDQTKIIRNTPVSPPGSASHTHLKNHCTSCHLCINKCPQKVLKPAGKEYGINGMMQPKLFFDKGYCDYNCNICSQVCPNKTIKPISLVQKQNTKIGTAAYLKSNCVVVTKGLNCLVCYEACPVGAIGSVKTTGDALIPYVDESRCIGCGACENICPATPFKAIYVEGMATHNLI